jgi:hypothetical protein
MASKSIAVKRPLAAKNTRAKPLNRQLYVQRFLAAFAPALENAKPLSISS